MASSACQKLFSCLHIGLLFGILVSPFTFVFVLFYKLCDLVVKQTKRKTISGEIAVVTGGAGGLGKEIATELAKYGCHVALVDINIEGADKIVKFIEDSFQVKGMIYKADISNYEDVVKLNEKILKDLGTPTILVNNAGIIQFTDNLNPDPREVQRMINVNQTAHFWTNRVFLPQMKDLGKGHIVAISSAASLFPLIYGDVYTSTKFAVRGLMQSLRLELNNENYWNIHTTTAFPYILETNQSIAERSYKTNFNKYYPYITGEEAAKTIVDGVLSNEQEIYLPPAFTLSYRLLEVLPIGIKMFIAKAVVDAFNDNPREIMAN